MADAIRTLTMAQALANRTAPAATWASIAGGFGGDVFPLVQPSFTIRASNVVFTIGSCFARNIEESLASLGCRVPMLDFRLPPDEWHGRSNGALNRFTPPAFHQTIAWAVRIHERGGALSWEEDCAPIAFDCGEDGFYDLDLVAAAPVSRARFVERRRHVYDIVSSVLTCDCMIMTPGLVEAWLDTETGLYIHSAPLDRRLRAAGERFRFELLGFEACYRNLEASIDLVRGHNPGVKVLVTTSPVPLARTFTGQDIRIANAYSKSTLRAACGQLAQARDQVDYFPSFESATLSPPASGVWMEDRQHVTPGFVGKIVGRLAEAYFEALDRTNSASQQARTALQAGEADRAIGLARGALELDPGHAECRSVLIDALLAREQWAEAEREIRALMPLRPADAELSYRLVRAVSRQGRDRTEEVVALCRSFGADPDATIGSASWAVRFLSRHAADAEGAEALARALIARLPLVAQAYQPLVELLGVGGRDDELIAVLETAASLPRPLAQHRVQLDRLRGGVG